MTEFHAGDLIGDYRLEARLGHGGFGTVWRARHVNTGRLVAVKILPENENLQDSATLRADVELLAASAASASQHIVQVLGGGTDPAPHVIMEFVNGTSLAEDLRTRGRFSQQEVIEIGLGIAAALQALQTVGIVHRDVKPSNVLIDRGGTVKLTDFGIAKIAGYDAVTVTGQLPLSISYAAPEVWEGKAEHRSDLYALGVLLYQCLCGTLPFRGAYAELFYQHRSQEPDLTALPPNTAPSLIDLISICLRKEPGERPESAATCIALLTRAREEIAAGIEEEELLVEPARFGPWVKGEHHPTQPWAWFATNAETGQEAVVELHFATTAEYGERLRLAVAENPRLTPLGAERLIQTNRLILRPGEAWTDPLPGQFMFWLAREEIALPDQPELIGATTLLGYTESLQALVDESRAAGLPLSLTNDTLFLLPDGSVHLQRPGLDLAYEGNPERDALDLLKTKHLTRDVRPLVSRAKSLEALRLSLERLMAIAAGTPDGAAVTERNGRMRLAGVLMFAGALVIAAVAALAFLLPGEDSSGEDNAVNSPAATMTAVPVTTACLGLALPVTLDIAQATCTQGTALRFDESCPTGLACRRETVDGIVNVSVNDRTVAFIDGAGKLVVARENGQNVLPLSKGENVVSAAWSPDGAYLAYVTLDPAGGSTAGGEPAVTTQLRIVDPGRPANDGLVLATNNLKDKTPDYLQRLISSPQWSADGRFLYFLWSLPGQAGGEVFSVELPRSAAIAGIDFSRLRSGSLADETRLDFPLSVLDVGASDFGVTSGYVAGISTALDGTLLLQLCQGTGANRGCGIGRWGSTATLLIEPARGVIAGLPVPSPFDGVLHVPLLEGGVWNFYRLDGTVLVPVPSISFPAATASTPPAFAFNRKGDALLIETTSENLSVVGYGTGAAIPWGTGMEPLWYVARGRPADAPPIPTPPAVAYATPAATATPTATPTVQVAQPMTMLVTVRRNGNAVSGVRVAATVNGIECATAITTAGVTSMQFPSPSAPAACRQTGSTIRFVIDGQQVATPTATYLPQANLPFDIALPN